MAEEPASRYATALGSVDALEKALGMILGEPAERRMFWVISTIGRTIPGAITGAGLIWLLSKDRQDRTLLA